MRWLCALFLLLALALPGQAEGNGRAALARVDLAQSSLQAPLLALRITWQSARHAPMCAMSQSVGCGPGRGAC